MKKILAMAAVVALTAGVSGYAANVNDNVKFSGDVNVKHVHVKDINPTVARVRLQADANLTDEVAVSGRVVFSDLVNEKDLRNEIEKGLSNVRLDRLHVMYSPAQVEGLKLDLGRTGVSFGNESDVYGASLDGAVLSYAKNQFAVEAGYGKARTAEILNLGVDVKKAFKVSPNAKYVKGSFDVNDKVNVGGYFIRLSDQNDMDIYGFNAKAKVSENVTLTGDVVRFDVPTDPTIKILGAKYGNVNDKVGSWEAGLKYCDLNDISGLKDVDIVKENFGNVPGVDYTKGVSLWKAEAKATVYKNVTLKSFLTFNGQIANVDIDNTWGLEFNYAF